VRQNDRVIDLQAVLARKQSRLFVPIVFRLAARWEQVDWEEFADPTGRAVEVLISPDAVRQPPLDGLIDVTRRLASDLQRDTAVIAVLTGPRTLGALVGAAAGLPDLYAALARAHAEAGARMLLAVLRKTGLHECVRLRRRALPRW